MQHRFHLNFEEKNVMMENLNKLRGVWLDTKQAVVVSFLGNQSKTETIISNIEDYHAVGGSRSKTPWGPMEVNQEKRYEERKKHQTRKYFDAIIEHIEGADMIYLFGPATMKQQLKSYLSEHYKFRDSTVTIERADVMTLPQMVAQVKKYFRLQNSIS